jgi:hypothetical protein
MNWPIWIANRSLTREDIPLQKIAGMMGPRADGKLVVTVDNQGVYEMHSDGTPGFSADMNSVLAGMTLLESKGRYGLLECPCDQLRVQAEGGVGVTQLVAWWNRL